MTSENNRVLRKTLMYRIQILIYSFMFQMTSKVICPTKSVKINLTGIDGGN
jgi:hypothetical protein